MKSATCMARGLAAVAGVVVFAGLLGAAFIDRSLDTRPFANPETIAVGVGVGLAIPALLQMVRSRRSAAMGIGLVAILLVVGEVWPVQLLEPFTGGIWIWATLATLLVRLARPMPDSAGHGGELVDHDMAQRPRS